MTIRRLPIAPASVPETPRRAWEDVLGLPASSGSPTGSTFWKRMRRCPREHALYTVAKLRRTTRSEPLTVGALWHLGLETYYKARMQGCAIGEAEAQAMRGLAQLEAEPGYEETFPEVVRLLQAYFESYRHEDAGWRVVAVEETLQYVSPELRYSVRLDLLVEIDGGLWIVEHKTARAITADLLTGYQLDMQILGQVWCFQNCVDTAAYPPLRGVVVNIESKHKMPRFERVQVCPSRDHLEAFETSMRQWTQLEHVFASMQWPRALGNCTGGARYFSTCDYFDVCHGQPRAGVEQLAVEEPPYGFVRADDALEVDDGEG